MILLSSGHKDDIFDTHNPLFHFVLNVPLEYSHFDDVPIVPVVEVLTFEGSSHSKAGGGCYCHVVPLLHDKQYLLFVSALFPQQHNSYSHIKSQEDQNQQVSLLLLMKQQRE